MCLLGILQVMATIVYDREQLLITLGQDELKRLLGQMILIRQFELRTEACYQAGKIGGFLHLYIGQEAIQTAAVHALGLEQWYTTTYRCHALALLLGESPHSVMAELYGKKTGTACGRGGSMHLFAKRLLGGLAIVGGQIPIATGAAFSCNYLQQKTISVCFMGDGAVAQGVFHECVNMSALWSLPCLYVVENNQWSMGTPLSRTLAHYDLFLANYAKAHEIPYIRLDGMDLLDCYAGFLQAHTIMKESHTPVIVECVSERFKGHSISDPGLYRTKDAVKKCIEKDPILRLKNELIDHHWLTTEEYDGLEQKARDLCVEATKQAELDPWPDPVELESDVYAPSTYMEKTVCS